LQHIVCRCIVFSHSSRLMKNPGNSKLEKSMIEFSLVVEWVRNTKQHLALVGSNDFWVSLVWIRENSLEKLIEFSLEKLIDRKIRSSFPEFTFPLCKLSRSTDRNDSYKYHVYLLISCHVYTWSSDDIMCIKSCHITSIPKPQTHGVNACASSHIMCIFSLVEPDPVGSSLGNVAASTYPGISTSMSAESRKMKAHVWLLVKRLGRCIVDLPALLGLFVQRLAGHVWCGNLATVGSFPTWLVMSCVSAHEWRELSRLMPKWRFSGLHSGWYPRLLSPPV